MPGVVNLSRKENPLQNWLTLKKAWIFVIFGELESLSVKVLH